MADRRVSRSPEPGSVGYLSARQRARKSKASERPSPLKALGPLVLLTLAVFAMWPPGFSVMRRLVIAGLGIVASVSPGFAYQTIDEVIADWKNQPQSTYPTEFTRGIIPKGIHSHNDYWRDVPLYSAIAVGAVSVEADVWLWNDELYVGHDPSSLSLKRTFSSLYVSPILSILKQQNPATSFPYTNDTRYGVFDAAVEQTLYLFVDVKTDGNTTWPLVIEQLEPLRKGGWLSYWDADAGVLHSGAVTVVGTGNTPFGQIQMHTTPHRDVFYDAPITTFISGASGEYNNSTAVIASGSLASALGGPISGSTLNDAQIAALTSQIQGAHAAGVKVRYWETPGWPLSKRDYIWKTLEGLGVDLLNADDLEAAAGLKEVW
ncbi:altered inheritance of mitochondria protein [Rhizoctonia solani AG-3 Rhs1AP]|uniref:Altered inheritance of mitochondria protein 6 n=1 Tax=Rhizoctonia solani AG-3 Rhs1AP TaxID=1086054 RepID=X8IVS7_9AGAM|nr:altered inheritance of mitochondria protein [Rhizoctonia solani AG-3 Rhs1AP]